MTAVAWIVALLAVGLGMMVLEVFVPSGGVLGFLSVVALGAGVATAFSEQGPWVGTVVLAATCVAAPLAPAYDWYSFNVLPRLGQWIAKDEASYRYLAESIRVHPDQETLKQMMEQSGFDRVEYHNLTAGVVAVHVGRVY